MSTIQIDDPEYLRSIITDDMYVHMEKKEDPNRYRIFVNQEKTPKFGWKVIEVSEEEYRDSEMMRERIKEARRTDLNKKFPRGESAEGDAVHAICDELGIDSSKEIWEKMGWDRTSNFTLASHEKVKMIYILKDAITKRIQENSPHERRPSMSTYVEENTPDDMYAHSERLEEKAGFRLFACFMKDSHEKWTVSELSYDEYRDPDKLRKHIEGERFAKENREFPRRCFDQWKTLANVCEQLGMDPYKEYWSKMEGCNKDDGARAIKPHEHLKTNKILENAIKNKIQAIFTP